MNFNDYVNQGVALFQEGKIGPALENFEAALKIQDNADIRQMVEMMKMQMNHASSAREAAANEAKERIKVFESFWGTTDYENVIAEYTQALKLDPTVTVQSIFTHVSAKNMLADAYYIRGLMFDSKGEDARAFEDYNEAVKNNPDFPFAIKRRGYASLEIGKYEQAIEDFEKMFQYEPDNAQWNKRLANVYSKRGIEYDKKGDYAHAVADFEMCVKLIPDDNTAHELLEMARAALGKKGN